MAAIRRTFETRPHRAAFKSWRRIGICATLITVALGGSLLACRRESDAEKGMRPLRNAFAKQRLIEPRLSGGFAHGEYDHSDNTAGINQKELDLAETLITNVAGKGVPSGDLAYGRLLLSRNENLFEASKSLRRALEKEPDSAAALNDLGVCLFLQDKIKDAIDKFEAALEREPNMPEALFNHALCYQRLLLRTAASEEFSRLLLIERDSGWRSEIQQRYEKVSEVLDPKERSEAPLRAFKEAFASGDRDKAQKIQDEYCEIILRHAVRDCPIGYLKNWLDGNRDEANRELSKLEFIGQRLAETRDDTSISDLAKHLSGLNDQDRARELKLIGDYNNLGNLIQHLSFQEGKAITERLARDFADLGNEFFQQKVIFQEAVAHYSRDEYEKSIEFATQALGIIDRHQWPFARAQGLIQLATAEPRVGRDDTAINHCEDILRLATGLPSTRSKALQIQSNAYGNLGDREKRLSSLQESTRILLANVPTLREVASNYLSIADYYQTIRKDRLALLSAQESLIASSAARDDRRAAEASAFAAVECARLDKFDQSEEFLNRAWDYVGKVRSDQQAYPRQYVLGCAAQIAEMSGDNEKAIKLYSDAVYELENIKSEKLSLITVLGARAEVYARAGDRDKASADLMRAIGEIEKYRENTAEQSRANFLDAQQSVFDKMIALQVRAFQNKTEAFNFSEQSRARTLFDEFKGRQSPSLMNRQLKPMTINEVTKALPPDVRLLTYSVTSSGTFLFLITSEGIEDVRESRVTTEEYDALVPDYTLNIKAKAPLEEVNEKGRTLYKHLIAPVEDRIRDGKMLCIAPDKALHFLPFAALKDGENRYLVQSCRLTYTPSASAFALCVDASLKKKSNINNEAILAVGNPNFNREQFPDLDDLKEAETEASKSVGFYDPKKRKLLMRNEATENRVKAALEKCDVAHLAAHCMVREKSPWLAMLLLADQRSEASAGSSQDDGLLSLWEVYNMNLPQTRLVVLSACQSALGQYYRGEGIVSLIRPFLVKRVPMVVASLWSVDSQATSELMIDFHKARKSVSVQGRAGDALRTAQIQMALSDSYKNHPFYWAPFIAVGSNN